jgi:uncharacterized protein (UPF0264 family)
MSPRRSDSSAAQLLVSVRSPAEAEAALAGGAAILDVKEPRHGPLGRADDAVLRAIVSHVAGRRLVSTALGELIEAAASLDVPAGLSFLKWGLARAAGLDWRATFLSKVKQLSSSLASQERHPATGAPVPRAVVVAYADAERAGAPPVGEVVQFACAIARTFPRTGGILLIDTFDKSPSTPSGRPLTLLDWLSLEAVTALCQRCRAEGVRVALAGSLGVSEIGCLWPARPDWFAVRGAACVGGNRGQEIDPERVRKLVRLAACGSVAGW